MKMRWLLLSAMLGAASFANPSRTIDVAGQVMTAAQAPVAGAMVTLRPGVAGPTAITVFTGLDGRYRFPPMKEKPPAGLNLAVSKTGFETVQIAQKPGSQTSPTIDVVLKHKANVAAEASPADWLDSYGLPHNLELQRTTLLCGDCHALPSSEMKRAATAFRGGNEEDRRTAWGGVVDQMRALFGNYLEEEGKSQAMITDDDKVVVSKLLAANLSNDFSSFSAAKWEKCCSRSAVSGSDKSVIREFDLAVDRQSWTREVIVPRGSKIVWGTDLQKNRIFRLDPATGALKWIAMPTGVGGLHTLIADDAGNFWGSALLTGSLVKFDPRTERFTVFPKFPSPDADPIIISDEARSSSTRLAVDFRGRVWVNLPSHNMLGSLDPATGEVHTYKLPDPQGRTARNCVLYGISMSADGKHVWWSQLFGNVGVFNTETLKNEQVITFPLGTGPRRMHIDDKDQLWIPLYGAGQLLLYDTKARKELARYDLPTRNAGVYSVTWDKKRNAIWAAAMETNSIFRFDIGQTRWSEYRMPRDGARFRAVPLDDEGNVWGSYATFPTLERPTMVMELSPGP